METLTTNISNKLTTFQILKFSSSDSVVYKLQFLLSVQSGPTVNYFIS